MKLFPLSAEECQALGAPSPTVPAWLHLALPMARGPISGPGAANPCLGDAAAGLVPSTLRPGPAWPWALLSWGCPWRPPATLLPALPPWGVPIAPGQQHDTGKTWI